MNLEDALVEELALAAKRRNTNKLDYYAPSQFQKQFHSAIGRNTDKTAVQKALMAANQIGKSYCGAMEVAIHATGLYPAWWTGHRFERPISVMVAGLTNESTRDICQSELFGEAADDSKLGTGAVPKHLIGKKNRKAGVPNALDSVFVKHKSGGWSKIVFRAYEQGPGKFMGVRIDLGWCDEEPPEDVWAQFIRATLATKGFLFITFTPENGITKVVYQFMSDLKTGQSLTTATWDDAPHMTGDRRAQALQAIPAHQREMRSKGIPLMGSGLVFQVPEDSIRISEVKISDWWPRICAVDYGMDHKFAAVWKAWDRDTDTTYTYDVYAVSGKTIADHVSNLNRHGKWIPIIWPHDMMRRDPKSGAPISQLYREEGANMMPFHFTNPPVPGQKEGDGGISIEAGVADMLHRMEGGRYKVLAHLKDYWDEFRMYHRKDGKIVDIMDDVMSADRYANGSLRHAITMPVRKTFASRAVGLRNW